MADVCSILGCENESKRSFPLRRVRSGMGVVKFKDDKARRAALCKDHYKAFKKATKEDRELERLGW